MDAVWNGKLDKSRDEAGSWVWGLVHRKEEFWGGGKYEEPHCNQWGVYSIAASTTLGFLVSQPTR